MKKLLIGVLLLFAVSAWAQSPPTNKWKSGGDQKIEPKRDTVYVPVMLLAGDRGGHPFPTYQTTLGAQDSVSADSHYVVAYAWLSVPMATSNLQHAGADEIYWSYQGADSQSNSLVGREISINVPGNLQISQGASKGIYGLIINGKPTIDASLGGDTGSISMDRWTGVYIDPFDVAAGMVHRVQVDTTRGVWVPSIDAPHDDSGYAKFSFWGKNNAYVGDTLTVVDMFIVPGTEADSAWIKPDTIMGPNIWRVNHMEHPEIIAFNDTNASGNSATSLLRLLGDSTQVRFLGTAGSFYIQVGDSAMDTTKTTFPYFYLTATNSLNMRGFHVRADTTYLRGHLVVDSGATIDGVGSYNWIDSAKIYGYYVANDTLYLTPDSTNGDTCKVYTDADTNMVIDCGGGAALFDSAYVDGKLWFDSGATVYLDSARVDSMINLTGRYAAAAGSGTADSMGVDTDGDGTVDNYLYSTTAGAFHLKKGSNITLTVAGDTVTIAGPAASGTADSLGVDTDGDGTVDGYMYSTTAGSAHLQKGYGLTFTLDTDTLLLVVDTATVHSWLDGFYIGESFVADFIDTTQNDTIEHAHNAVYSDSTGSIVWTNVLSVSVDSADFNATEVDEYIADKVGAMLTGNTETSITVTYQDGDNTIDFEVTGGGAFTSTDSGAVLMRSTDTAVNIQSLTDTTRFTTDNSAYLFDKPVVVASDGLSVFDSLQVDTIFYIASPGGTDTTFITNVFLDSIRADHFGGGSGSTDSVGADDGTNTVWSVDSAWTLAEGSGVTFTLTRSDGNPDTVYIAADLGTTIATAEIEDSAVTVGKIDHSDAEDNWLDNVYQAKNPDTVWVAALAIGGQHGGPEDTCRLYGVGGGQWMRRPDSAAAAKRPFVFFDSSYAAGTDDQYDSVVIFATAPVGYTKFAAIRVRGEFSERDAIGSCIDEYTVFVAGDSAGDYDLPAGDIIFADHADTLSCEKTYEFGTALTVTAGNSVHTLMRVILDQGEWIIAREVDFAFTN